MTQMEFEAFEGIIKFTFIIGLFYWFMYNTRELAFDYVLESKIRPSNDFGFLWRYLWRCIQMVVVIMVSYAITMDLVRHYLSPGQ
jgi:hypothetical protein